MNGQWLKLPCEIVVRVFSDVLGWLQLLINIWMFIDTNLNIARFFANVRLFTNTLAFVNDVWRVRVFVF